MAKTPRIPKPFGSYVVIQPKDIEKKTSSGIVLAHANEERKRGSMTEGTVVAIGPLAFKDEMNPSGEPWYQVGDRVIFVKYGGKLITYDNEVYGVFRYEDVMCKLEEEVAFQDGEKDD
jgi:chaperonin GroES